MPRKASPTRLNALKETVNAHPGRKPSFLARMLGWPIEVVVRTLTSLNDRGVLFSEDERGGIWPFENRR